MNLVEIDEQLLEHLEIEFGPHGRDAVEFVRTAWQLLTLNEQDRPPRTAETAVYCLREAAKRILDSVDDEGGGEWRTSSRRVVEARSKYEQAIGVPGEDELAALSELLRAIDELEDIHAREGRHERRLIAIVLARTGGQPLSSGTAPVRAYVDLLRKLDSALHSQTSFDVACELWNRCITVLSQLFLPPDVRTSQLEEIGKVAVPTAADVARVRPLLATPTHLGVLVRHVSSVRWLRELTEAGLLAPPDADAPWHAFGAVSRLAETEEDAVAGWLADMFTRYGGDPRAAWSIARASLDAGSSAVGIVEECLRRHPDDHNILAIGVRAVELVAPDSPVVERLADLLLNREPWSQLGYVDPVLEALLEGVGPANAIQRLQLVCWKIAAIREDEDERRWLLADQAGSLGELEPDGPDDRYGSLLATLTRMTVGVLACVPVEGVLDVASSLPEDVELRFRPWVLSKAPNVDIGLILNEMSAAIRTREPFGDDLPLLDRIAAEVPRPEYLDRWQAQFGEPPSVADVAAALRDGETPGIWWRAYHWMGLVPELRTRGWEGPLAVFAGNFGDYGRERIETRQRVATGWGRSPISQGELAAMEPLEAGRVVADWRPDPSDWLVGARELARTLEEVARADPGVWLASPLQLAVVLHHPVYIAHYIRAAASTVKSGSVLDVNELLDVIALVDAEPWDAVRLGRDDFDFDLDWRGCRRESVDLLKALADANVGFANRDEDVWDLLHREARDRSEPSGIISGARDPLDSAINRPCTRALDAVLAVMAYEYRQTETVRPQSLQLIEECLNLEGRDGAESRAIIATRLAFLRHIAPEWFGEIEDMLVGASAPDDLAQVTVDLAVKWSRPNRWLLENHRGSVLDAVEREVEKALDHYLVAMLWRLAGYGVLEVIDDLAEPSLVSKAGELLGRLLRRGQVDPDHLNVAIEFWDAVIAQRQGAALTGFGWMAEVSAIDDTLWTFRTLETLQLTKDAVDWSHKVAERAGSQLPSASTLAIMNLLVRSPGDPWRHRQNLELAVQHLQAAGELAGTVEYHRLRTSLQERDAL
jgi:hypothetical protein